jgi:uncharacterized protein (UPF0332 family)
MMIDDRVETIFGDAESLYTEAIEELKRGKIRDASEKAWGATARATNALILARTGEEVEGTRGLTRKFLEISGEDGELREKLEGRFFSRESVLHGHCFYMGACEPIREIERRIKETKQYIEEARKLAKVF